MDTFSSDYISSGNVGITSNITRGMSRAIEIPIRKPIFLDKHKKQIKDISETIKRLADLISKAS